MKTAITVILIIVAVAAVLFFLPLIIMFFSYGMPHGSNTSDSTALLAIKIAGTDTAERIKELKGRIQELKKLRTEISKEIYSLTPIHKAIICGFYLQGQKWERIAEQISYSVRQSKNIRCVALEVLGGKLARNRNISRSKILKEVLH